VIRKNGTGQFDGWVHDDRTNTHLQIRTTGVVLNLAAMMAVHQRYYTKRGRTRKVNDRYLVSPDVFAEYLKFLYTHVGRAKAGWLPAATRLFTPNIPGWVLRHAPGKGFFHDNRNDARPSIEAINVTKWANRDDEGDRIVRGAVAARARDMATYAETQMRLALKKTGFSAA